MSRRDRLALCVLIPAGIVCFIGIVLLSQIALG
jgi:hypothetical protein